MWKRDRHRHMWRIIKQTYTPSSTDDFSAWVTSRELVERAIFGITTVTQECKGCGKRQAYTVAGDGRV